MMGARRFLRGARAMGNPKPSFNDRILGRASDPRVLFLILNTLKYLNFRRCSSVTMPIQLLARLPSFLASTPSECLQRVACKHVFRFGADTVSTSETDAKVKAGLARAASLSDERRREIARD